MSDFREHTCGECAWAIDGRVDNLFVSFCRRCAYGLTQSNEDYAALIGAVKDNDPACPAFVPKEKPAVPERLRCPKCGTFSGVRWTAGFVSAGQINIAECFMQCGHRSRAFSKTEDALADFYKPIKETAE